jgi:hypothetical protein
MSAFFLLTKLTKMKKVFGFGFPILFLMAMAAKLNAQPMQMGEVLMVSNAQLKPDVKPEEFLHYFQKELMPAWNKPASGNSVYLFTADRGDRKGSYLLVCTSKNVADRAKLPAGSPFNDQSISGKIQHAASLTKYLSNTNAYTEYHVIGAGQFKPMPQAGLLGMHYIKVKQDSQAGFEKFVAAKLNPTVGHLLPDLQLLYLKGTAGEKAGTYLLIFVLKSPGARDKYWPAGAPETEALKNAFRPYKGLAKDLSAYLVEDSYLKPESGGAAAYFESLEWTDYID